MTDYITEPVGFKIILGGGAFAALGDWLAGIDWSSVVGVTVMVFGAALSYAAYLRNEAQAREEHAARESERVAREATQKREQEKHIAEMAILNYRKKQIDDEETLRDLS